MNNGGHYLKTVQRAFEIVSLLSNEGSFGVSELARRLELNKATVHGYLRTLEATGYVVNRGGRYDLSLQFLNVGGRMKYRSRFFQLAKPQVHRLAETTGFCANLTVRENDQLVILHTVESDRSLQLGIYSGMRASVHSNASGKVLLAHAPAEIRETVLQQKELNAVTEHTITEPETLLDELETIRQNGYAVDWDGQVVGMGSVAAPIDDGETVLGSIEVVCATSQLSGDDARSELVDHVCEAASVTSVNYQYGR